MCTPDTLLSSIVTVSLRTSHQKNLESRENINDKINHVYQILILFSALHTYSVSFNAENNTLRRGPAHPLSYRGGNRLSDVNEVAQDRRMKTQDSKPGDVDPQTMHLSTSCCGYSQGTEQEAEKGEA